MPYLSTKTFGPERGFSCAFRQWRAHSHCRFIHGYALGVKLTFGASELDGNGWVVDFGGLKPLQTILEDTFDHKLLVAQDDPWLSEFQKMSERSGAHAAVDLIVVPRTGCEAFAQMIYEVADQWLIDAGFGPRCWVVSVEVSEHGANSAIYVGER